MLNKWIIQWFWVDVTTKARKYSRINSPISIFIIKSFRNTCNTTFYGYCVSYRWTKLEEIIFMSLLFLGFHSRSYQIKSRLVSLFLGKWLGCKLWQIGVTTQHSSTRWVAQGWVLSQVTRRSLLGWQLNQKWCHQTKFMTMVFTGKLWICLYL